MADSRPASTLPPAQRCDVPTCDQPAADPSNNPCLCESHHEARLGEAGERSEPDEAPSLDSNRESRTDPQGGDSSRQPDDSDSNPAEDPSNWDRQQKRTFHRVKSLLYFWEQNGYQIRWLTLTSGPNSDDADQLAYNHRRLRQTVERARLARDADGDTHRLDHVREIESLTIRTSEGPAGKGVLHVFWAWKPPEGQHSRDFYVPHDWLAKAWGRIHGGDDLAHQEDECGPARPSPRSLYVWIKEVGGPDYHSMDNLAAYCVSQYLGDHGEALENVSWSWERSLGGSVTNAWETIRNLTDSLESAIDVWESVLRGEGRTLSSTSETVQYRKVVHPPPNLGVEVTQEVSVTPPDDWERAGPHARSIRTATPDVPEHDLEADGRTCPECGSAAGLQRISDDHPDHARWRHPEAIDMVCTACKRGFADPGAGVVIVEDKQIAKRWTWKQSRLSEWTRVSSHFDQLTSD